MCKKKPSNEKEVVLHKVICPCCGKEYWAYVNPVKDAVILINYAKGYATLYNKQETMKLLDDSAANGVFNYYIYTKIGNTDTYWCPDCCKWFARLTNLEQSGCCCKKNREPINLRLAAPVTK